MKKILLFIGPLLFLLAELILPGGSADPGARIAIIQENSFAWEFGHQLIAIAFLFLLVWLGELYTFVRQGNGRIALLGLLFTIFALIADYGVGILQLLTLELVQRQPPQHVQDLLAMMSQSTNLMAFAFLPTLGFLIGFGLLAVSFFRRTSQKVPPILLSLSGLLIALGGVLQMKNVFILGALALLAFTAMFFKSEGVSVQTSTFKADLEWHDDGMVNVLHRQ